MESASWRARQRLALGGFALLAVMAVPNSMAGAASTAHPARAASAAASQDAASSMAAQLMQWTRNLLALSPGLDVSPSTRSAIEAMARDHLARMEPVYRQWVGEERARLGKAATEGQVYLATVARFHDEVARWRLLPAGAAHDNPMRAAALKPAVCRKGQTPMDAIAAAIDEVPDSQRAAVLAGERAMLARWGTSDSADLPPRPIPSARDEERSLLERLRRGEAIDASPLPPVVAGFAFMTDPSGAQAQARCALDQWWLANALRRPGANTDDVYLRFAYAGVLEAFTRDQPIPLLDTDEGPDGYPVIAQKVGLEGVIRVEIDTDAAGRFLRGRVIHRDLKASSLREGHRPLAYETLLDDASLARARTSWKPASPAAGSPASAPPKTVAKIDILWRLK
jgi:hypothetical protein